MAAAPRPRAGLWAIVVAAGSGVRFGGEVPKQELDLGGLRVLDRAVAALDAWCPGRVVVVVRPDRLDPPDPVAAVAHSLVAGGATRSASVRAGLAALPADAGLVLVHDAARPLVPVRVVADLLAEVEAGADGAIPGMPVADTIKRVVDGTVVDTPPRAELVAVQTPQLFRAEVLRRVHAGGGEATDDAALVEAAGGRIRVVSGDPDLRKVTTAEDLEWLRGRLASWS